jgi:hypothetical protein
MIESNEPKDGDFIAYIEQLQKQQAARLVVAKSDAVTFPGAPGTAMQNSGRFEEHGNPTIAETSRAAREHLRQSALPLAKLVGAALPLLVGVLIGLHWLIAGSGLAQLVVALVLVIFGARRLKRTLVGFTTVEKAQASALIAQMLAKSGKR